MMFWTLMFSLLLMSFGATALVIAGAARLVNRRVNSQYYVPCAALALLVGLVLFVLVVVGVI
jgi:hypothetical protein